MLVPEGGFTFEWKLWRFHNELELKAEGEGKRALGIILVGLGKRVIFLVGTSLKLTLWRYIEGFFVDFKEEHLCIKLMDTSGMLLWENSSILSENKIRMCSSDVFSQN